MPVVRMPDDRLVRYPDEMPQADIKAHIESVFPYAYERAPITRKSTLSEEFKRGYRSQFSSARAGIESLLGDADIAAEAGAERQEDIAADYGVAPSLATLRETATEEGLPAAVLEGITQIPRSVFGQIAPVTTWAGGMRLGAMAVPIPQLKPLAGIAGAALALYPQFLGFNIQRQAEEQLASGEEVDINLPRAIKAAAGQSAVETAGTGFVFGKGVIRAALGLSPRDVLRPRHVRQLVRVADRSLKNTVLRGVTRGAAAEMPVEVAQQVMERYAADLDLLSDDAMEEYGEAAYLAATVGGTFGGVSNIGRPMAARGRLAREQARTQEEALVAAEEEAKTTGTAAAGTAAAAARP